MQEGGLRACSINAAGKSGYPLKKKLDFFFTLYTEMNSKGVINLCIKGKTIKILPDNIWEYLNQSGIGKDFLNMLPKVNYRSSDW